MRKNWLFIALLGLLVVLPSSWVAADEPVEGRAGRAEVRFLEGMIDHHQMALDMAADCLPKASTDELSTLCQNIIDAQSAEIATMQGWLLDWYNVEYTPIAMSGGDMGGMNMEGMPTTDPAMMMGMMAGLNRAEGVDYDIAFLELMIDHHDDALHMSTRILERDPEGTGHEELRTLAQQIITDQTAEIDMMEALITSLSA